MNPKRNPNDGSEAEVLTRLLLQHQSAIAAHLRREGAGLLRYESVSDLEQGVRLHAIRVASEFEYQSDGAFIRWIEKVARQHLTDRHRYWRAKKRDAGCLLRLTASDATESQGGAREPAGPGATPVTLAERKEQLALAARAVALLLPRDQEIVGCVARGLSIREISEELEIGYEATERARLRTLDRFRKAYRVVAGLG